MVIANNVIAPIGTNGNVCLYTNVASDIVVDIDGYFEGTTVDRFVATTPKRLIDTRATTEGKPQMPAPALALNKNNAGVVGLALGLTEGTLQATESPVKALLDYVNDPTASGSCALGGSISVSYLDADGDFAVSAGDTATITYHACHDDILGDIVSGSIDLQLTRFDIANGKVGVSGDLTLGKDFTLTSIDSGVSSLLAGNWSFSFDESQTTVLTARASNNQYWQQASSTIEKLSHFTMTKVIDALAAGEAQRNTEVSYRLAYSSGALGGSVNCETDSVIVFTGFNTGVPHSMMLCKGANNTEVQVSGSGEVSLDTADGSGAVQLGTLAWNNFLTNFFPSTKQITAYKFQFDVPSGRLGIDANDAAYVASTDTLLVATASDSALDPNALVAVDFSTGGVKSLIQFANTPNKVRVSNDGTRI